MLRIITIILVDEKIYNSKGTIIAYINIKYGNAPEYLTFSLFQHPILAHLFVRTK